MSIDTAYENNENAKMQLDNALVNYIATAKKYHDSEDDIYRELEEMISRELGQSVIIAD